MQASRICGIMGYMEPRKEDLPEDLITATLVKGHAIASFEHDPCDETLERAVEAIDQENAIRGRMRLPGVISFFANKFSPVKIKII